MHDIEFPFLGPMHFEARLGQSLFCRPFLSLFITSINKSIFFTLTRSVNTMIMIKLNWNVLFNDIKKCCLVSKVFKL